MDKQGGWYCRRNGEKYAKKGKVVLKIENDTIIIKPYKLADLTEFFAKIEVDIKSDLSDWRSVRMELLEAR